VNDGWAELIAEERLGVELGSSLGHRGADSMCLGGADGVCADTLYDLGRRVSTDSGNLRGLGDISPALVAKLYGSWVLSKAFPVVVQADVRQFVGGATGALGDLEFYLPLPGSSRRFVMLGVPPSLGRIIATCRSSSESRRANRWPPAADLLKSTEVRTWSGWVSAPRSL
jgi:hypothetical protein